MLIPLHTISVAIVIKKSKFIAIAVPIESADQAKNIISLTKKEHPDASHVVHAYILGKNRDIFSMSDDREPRNTAGRPVLEVLKGSGITNIMVMVVRYFGGTKLGTGGLVHAYSDAAKKVLFEVPVEKLVRKTSFSLIIDYRLYEQAKRLLVSHHTEIVGECFEMSITITGNLPETDFLAASRQISDLSSGKSTLIPTL